MRILRFSLRLGLFIMFLLSIACTSSKFVTWKDRTYQGHTGKILVINAFQNVETRRIFEDALVKALKERGVDSVARYAVIDKSAMSDKDTFAAQAKEVGADTVLITRPVGTRLGKSGTLDMFINTQTDVYDMKSNRLILIATSETQIPEGKPSQNQIQAFVKDLVNQLSGIGLF
jgi:hypothetical protein